MRDRTGHDFSQYKRNTLVRRIERRMALHQIDRPGDYLRYTQQKPNELDALFRDLLIGVTNFFRDPDAFAALEQWVVGKAEVKPPPPRSRAKLRSRFSSCQNRTLSV